MDKNGAGGVALHIEGNGVFSFTRNGVEFYDGQATSAEDGLRWLAHLLGKEWFSREHAASLSSHFSHGVDWG